MLHPSVESSMRVFITGGTGSLGSYILSQCSRLKWYPTVYSRDEVKQAILKSKYPNYRYILGDITDYNWLKLSMREHDIVIHTAAYKQVPAAEANSIQASRVNVIGSMNVVDAAIENNIRTVVGISTDKACSPANCYGATKMLMEKIFQEASYRSDTVFNVVRYGNVLGSRGSVVPFFRQQVKSLGYVTLTDPNMTRFWLTLEEAFELVYEGVTTNYSGVVIVPKCKSSSMMDLALAMVPESSIKIIGIRAGEKIHECLVAKHESLHTVNAIKYFYIQPAIEKPVSDTPFEYTSDKAERYSIDDLRGLLEYVEDY